jgi:hypothetical protein
MQTDEVIGITIGIIVITAIIVFISLRKGRQILENYFNQYDANMENEFKIKNV